MNKKVSILNRPNLNRINFYDSKALFTEHIVTPEKEQVEESLKKHIQIESAKKLLMFVPGELKHAVESIINLVHFFLILVEDETKDYEEEIIIEENDKDEKDDIFTDGHKPTAVIKTEITEQDKIKNEYARNILEVNDYYIYELKEILTNFICKLNNEPEILDYINSDINSLVNANKLEMVNKIQVLLKTSQEKQSKMRLYKKLYTEKESLVILRSLEYSKLSLLNLSKEKKLKDAIAMERMQTYLGEAKKLEKKQFEYFRYLNSSLSLLDKCMSLHFSEGLLKKEIFKLEEKLNEDTTS